MIIKKNNSKKKQKQIIKQTTTKKDKKALKNTECSKINLTLQKHSQEVKNEANYFKISEDIAKNVKFTH